LTGCLDSEHGLAEESAVIHQEAANPENKVTKGQLRDLTERIAHGLRHNYGIGKDGPNKDVVTVISHGQILVPAVYFGIIAAGGVYSAASPSSTVSELKRQVDIGNSRLIVCGSEHIDAASKAATELSLPLSNVLLLDSTYQKWSLSSVEGGINALSDERLPWPRITDPTALKNSLVTILWSSGKSIECPVNAHCWLIPHHNVGTTGLPKGVMLSHLNLVTELIVTSFSGRQLMAEELAKGNELPKVEYRTLAHLPISHIAGLISYITAPILAGGNCIWMRKYSWNDFVKYLEKYSITVMYTVPSIYLRISKAPEISDHFKNLIGATTGAAPMDSELQKAANAKLGDGQQAMIGQTWGLSETTGAVTAMPAGWTDDTGSISPPLPTVEIRCVDENYNDVEPGQEGELIVRSPLVMNGYYNNPKATKEAFHEDWFCSGDIGVMRDGKFYVVDRKKELLKYKGLQV
jgi:4-coumarate--CoA ligase